MLSTSFSRQGQVWKREDSGLFGQLHALVDVFMGRLLHLCACRCKELAADPAGPLLLSCHEQTTGFQRASGSAGDVDCAPWTDGRLVPYRASLTLHSTEVDGLNGANSLTSESPMDGSGACQSCGWIARQDSEQVNHAFTKSPIRVSISHIDENSEVHMESVVVPCAESSTLDTPFLRIALISTLNDSM